MNESVEFLLRHGYSLLFAFVLAEQVGLPVPATPMLLAAGALAGLGHMSLSWSLLLAVIASLAGDLLWFLLGRFRGASILNLFCRISLEPDTCVRKTQTTYSRHGVNWLMFAKFVPGLSTIAPPMAGMFRVSPWKFLALDAVGSVLWAGAYLLLGWAFRNQLELVAFYLEKLGSGLIVLVLVALLGYIAFKYIQRQRVYRDLRIARITAHELKKNIDQGDTVILIDLRSEYERTQGSIPGSLSPVGDDLETLVPVITQNEIVLYCSCPNEESAARAALRLKRYGVAKVRPLEGGFALWKELGFPVEGMTSPANN